jgi:hypothetical protein
LRGTDNRENRPPTNLLLAISLRSQASLLLAASLLLKARLVGRKRKLAFCLRIGIGRASTGTTALSACGQLALRQLSGDFIGGRLNLPVAGVDTQRQAVIVLRIGQLPAPFGNGAKVVESMNIISIVGNHSVEQLLSIFELPFFELFDALLEEIALIRRLADGGASRSQLGLDCGGLRRPGTGGIEPGSLWWHQSARGAGFDDLANRIQSFGDIASPSLPEDVALQRLQALFQRLAVADVPKQYDLELCHSRFRASGKLSPGDKGPVA